MLDVSAELGAEDCAADEAGAEEATGLLEVVSLDLISSLGFVCSEEAAFDELTFEELAFDDFVSELFAADDISLESAALDIAELSTEF